MEEEGDVGAERRGCERMAAGRAGGDERRPERAEEKYQADGAKLGERLEVEAVRIANGQVRSPVPEPEALVAAAAPAEPRVIFVLPPGHSPVLRAAAAGETEEPLARLRLDERRRGVERVVGASYRCPRTADADEGSRHRSRYDEGERHH